MGFRILTLVSLVALTAGTAAKPEEKANDASQTDGGTGPLPYPRIKRGITWPPALANLRGRGLAIFRCDITKRGTAQNCTVERGVDGLTNETLIAFANTLGFDPAQHEDGTAFDFPGDRFSMDLRPARAPPDGGAYHASGADDDPVNFAPDMKKPKFDVDRSAPFHWKARQLDAHTSGMVLVQCDLTKAGHLWNCIILKTIEGVSDEQVYEFANSAVYSPAEFPDGGAVAIARFTIPLHLRVP